MTAQQLIERSLRLIGVYDVGGTPATADLNTSLEALNSLASFWGSQSWCPPGQFQTSKALTASDGTYTVGAGQDIAITLPTKIVSAWVRDSDNLDSPLEIISQAEYAAIYDKTVEGEPEKLCFVRTGDTGTIYLWPVPDTTDTLYFDYNKQIGSYALADSLGLPTEYERPLGFNLAVDLCLEFGVEASQTLYDQARKSLASLKAVNAQPVPRVCTDTMGIDSRPAYNVYTDN